MTGPRNYARFEDKMPLLMWPLSRCPQAKRIRLDPHRDALLSWLQLSGKAMDLGPIQTCTSLKKSAGNFTCQPPESQTVKVMMAVILSQKLTTFLGQY